MLKGRNTNLETSIKIYVLIRNPSRLSPLGGILVEVRDSRTGYLVPGHFGPGLRQMSRVVGKLPPSSDTSWGGCRPRAPLQVGLPASRIHWLIWLSGCQDGCPVAWFDWVAARMAVQLTGLIEWLPGWLSSWLVWLSGCQDGWFLEWVVSSISRKWKYKLPRVVL